MPVQYDEPLFRRRRPLSGLARQSASQALLRRANVDFIPDGRRGIIHTAPLIEENNLSWRNDYASAANILLTNPLCFAAQSLINDELADARMIVEVKKNGKWHEKDDHPLTEWLKTPNGSMDDKEIVRAYSTHIHTFGSVTGIMFQPRDILPSGKINQQRNCFDIIHPARIVPNHTANAYHTVWNFHPIGYEKDGFSVQPDYLFRDVIYNPIAHSTGISLPSNPLRLIFKIHNLFMRHLHLFFDGGAMPSHILTRIVDMQKDAMAASITDDQIEEALDRVYSQVGRGGSRENGWLGLRGDWRVNKVGSDLPNLINADLLQYIDALVSAVYKVPPSIFWGGMKASGQRASRQQDSIDFYNMKIKPTLDRIGMRLTKYLIPLLVGDNKDVRISFDKSEMALAQYAVTKEYRMYERWWQMRVINRGTFLNFVNEDTSHLTEEEKLEYYAGGAGMTVATGEQSVEEDNGLE